MNPIHPLLNRVIHVKQWKHRTRIIWRYYLTSKQTFDPVFVVSAGRDGSNLLVDYLNSLPGVSVAGEVLSAALHEGIRHKFITKAAVLRHIKYSLHNLDNRICGVKFHFAQMQTRQISLNDIRQAFPTAKFIILYRRSIARQYISQQRAVVSGQWLLRKHEKAIDNKIRIDPSSLNTYYDRIKQFYKDLPGQAWIKQCGVILSYEELTDHPQTLFDEIICPFLGLPFVKISTKLMKQNTKPMHEVVENYAQVEEMLTGDTAFHEYRL